MRELSQGILSWDTFGRTTMQNWATNRAYCLQKQQVFSHTFCLTNHWPLTQQLIDRSSLCFFTFCDYLFLPVSFSLSEVSSSLACWFFLSHFSEFIIYAKFLYIFFFCPPERPYYHAICVIQKSPSVDPCNVSSQLSELGKYLFPDNLVFLPY